MSKMIVSVLIKHPSKTLKGALIERFVSCTILFYLIVLGIEVQDDGGTLFILAVITFLCCSVLVYKKKSGISDLLKLKF